MAGRRLLIGLYAWLVMAFLALPAMIVIPLSFSSVRYYVFPPPGWSTRWYQDFLESETWRSAVGLSIGIGIVSMILALVLGTLAASALANATFRGRSLLFAFLLAPLVVPAIVLAVALYQWFVKLGLIGSPVAVVLGHVVVATPFVVVVMTSALQGLDPNYSRAAVSLGAHPITAFVRVTLPLVRPAAMSAAFLAFLASFDELLIATFLSAPAEWTLPVQMFRGMRVSGPSPTIAAVSTLLIVIALVGVAIQSTQWGRRRPAGGSDRN